MEVKTPRKSPSQKQQEAAELQAQLNAYQQANGRIINPDGKNMAKPKDGNK